jgi:hypothetical protein
MNTMLVIAKNSGREAEGVRGNSGERSSKELHQFHLSYKCLRAFQSSGISLLRTSNASCIIVE